MNSGTLNLIEPRAETGSYPGVSWREYGDLRERLHSFSDLIAGRMVPFSVGERGRVERAFALLVSGNYFTALGLTPAAGRFIRADEVEHPGAAPVVVISHDYWRSHFNSDPAAIGRDIRVNDRLLTIVGVTPSRFQGTHLGLSFDMWAPATLAPVLLAGSLELDDRGLRGYSVLGRLAPHVNVAQAQAELEQTMGDLAREYPESNANLSAEVLPFWQAPRGPQRMLANSLVILQGVMLLLLLAVCGNTANLMLARATVRQREMGVRLALGASRPRIARLLLVENLLLAGLARRSRRGRPTRCAPFRSSARSQSGFKPISTSSASRSRWRSASAAARFSGSVPRYSSRASIRKPRFDRASAPRDGAGCATC